MVIALRPETLSRVIKEATPNDIAKIFRNNIAIVEITRTTILRARLPLASALFCALIALPVPQSSAYHFHTSS